MSKVFGILTFVIGIWVTLEIVNHGVSGAFGDVLSRGDTTVAERQSVPDRAGSAVEDAHAAGEQRRARMLGE